MKTEPTALTTEITHSRRKGRRRLIWAIVIAVVIAIAVAVGVGAGVGLNRSTGGGSEADEGDQE